MKKTALILSLSALLSGCASVGKAMYEEAKTQASKTAFVDPKLKPKDIRNKTVLFQPLSPHVIERLPVEASYDADVSGFKNYGNWAPRNLELLENHRAWADSFNVAYRKSLSKTPLAVRVFPFDSLVVDTAPVPETSLARADVPVKDITISAVVPDRNYADAEGARSAQFGFYISKLLIHSKEEQAYEQFGSGAQSYSVKMKGQKETYLEFEFFYTLWDYTNNRVAATGFFKQFGKLSGLQPIPGKEAAKFAARIPTLIRQMQPPPPSNF
jgi:hypothetical protein